jgi:hypothetical protein
MTVLGAILLSLCLVATIGAAAAALFFSTDVLEDYIDRAPRRDRPLVG